MIELTDTDIIGEGTRRVCFCHPEDNSRCIKIPKVTRLGVKQQKREVKYYQYLIDKGIPTRRITNYYGSVETNRGTGYIYDLVRDENGEISRQFVDYLKSPDERSEQYINVVRTLEKYFIENRVLFYDLNPWNILCRASSDGQLEPFVTDGVGDVVAIPILNQFDHLLVAKIERRWGRFIVQLKRHHVCMQDYRPGSYRDA